MKASPRDIDFMQRALDLARQGRGSVEPNPMVGCVVVKHDRIIGEGFHQRFGQPHAEPNALASCTTSPDGATAYVTLEPCCHADKKTPPCVPALIEAKLARVIVSCVDPNPAVSGRGILQLRAAGVEVVTGALEVEARQLNAAFFARVLLGRPYVTLKWAQSADGKVAGPGGQRRQISGEASMRAVHLLRARCDVILIGASTARIDDPLLTSRHPSATRQPLRAVLDPNLTLAPDSHLARSCAAETPVLLYCSSDVASSDAATKLIARGVTIVPVPREAQHALSLQSVLTDLAARGATHVVVEAGPALAAAFQRANLADRIWLFDSRTPVAGPTAPSAAEVASNFRTAGERNLDGDTLTERLNESSPAFFAALPSPDFLDLDQ